MNNIEWQSIKTLPKDGAEYLTVNNKQGNILSLVNWNTIYGYWESKGKAISMQATHWFKIPNFV